MADQLVVASVYLWRRLVGAIAEDTNGVVAFEYDDRFRRSRLEISPEKLPLSLAGPVSFPELARVEAFLGLPGVFSDSLPDRFGNAVIAKYFESRGRPRDALSPVQKLLYVGNRGMGALEYRPPILDGRNAREREPLEVARLVEEARKIVEGAPDVAFPEMMKISSSAGGARAKAVVLLNNDDNVVRSAFAKPQKGDEHWILKFDGVGELGNPDPKPAPFNRIEYVYGQMAGKAGIEMPEMRLLEERDFAHLMIKRFDRDGQQKIHMHSLGGLEHADYNQPQLYSYERYFRVVNKLNLGYPALEQAFRRAVFNILAVNQDDHVKNLSFLMDMNGDWRLSPAYDLTYARGGGFTRTHQMTFADKDTGITIDDILSVGRQFGIKKHGQDVINDVIEGLSQWRTLAKDAGVPIKRIDQIESEYAKPAQH
ncbi:MAG TPA: type II toxin-antitoxin system HipA family toxin [Burkholderiales bacterium]|jgi:serine/threonine-protein kinase HipA|nr:type II toxin-antitoxin system HipA family toxin [Burkholderiales bacterium]